MIAVIGFDISTPSYRTSLALSSEERVYQRAASVRPRFDTSADPGLLSASGVLSAYYSTFSTLIRLVFPGVPTGTPAIISTVSLRLTSL